MPNKKPNVKKNIPIAREITHKKSIEVITGPAIVCPKTVRNLSVSFK